MIQCGQCGKTFTRPDSLTRHLKYSCKAQQQPVASTSSIMEPALSKKRGNDDGASSSTPLKRPCLEEMQTCTLCHKCIKRRYFHLHLRSLSHKSKVLQDASIGRGIQKIASAFDSKISTFRISGESEVKLEDFFACIRDRLKNTLQHELSRLQAIKANLELYVAFIKPSENGDETCEREIKRFSTNYAVLTMMGSDVDEYIDDQFWKLKNELEEFEQNGSGWLLESIQFVEITTAQYQALRGSSYIPTPQRIASKKAVVNVRNVDNLCFVYSILASLHPIETNPHFVSNYTQYMSELKIDSLTFPLAISDIRIFEKLNPEISVNVFSLDEKCNIVGPLYFSKEGRKRQHHVNLLYLETEDGVNFHYCLIKNLSKLVGRQLSSKTMKKYLCDFCLQYFSTNEILQRHMEQDCDHCVVEMPTDKNNTIFFKEFDKKYKVPFVIYADFETVLAPLHTCEKRHVDEYVDRSDYNSEKRSFTNTTHLHIPFSFSYFISCSFNNQLSQLRTYRGADCAKKFVSMLESDAREIYHKHLKEIQPMKPLTAAQEIDFINSTHCHICEGPYAETDVKVRDHNHIGEGEYLGSAHQSCNLNRKVVNFIPVFFHNFSNYDAHLFIKELAADGGQIDVIAQTKEKYISFSKHVDVSEEGATGRDKKYVKLRFLDSFRFMAKSLSQLASFLSDEQCIRVRKYFPDNFQLMRQKGVFPYSYVDSIEKLEQTTELPAKEHFFSTLENKPISDEDYQLAKNVWERFSCKNLGEYSDLYLTVDTLLLADIFEAFRETCIRIYTIDPAHVFTAPGLSYLAMLKTTKIRLELLTDIEMMHFVKRGIRGGYAAVITRHAQANNEYVPNYKPNEETKFLIYYDVNNLYGKSLSDCLPYGGFRWLTAEECESFQIGNVGVHDEYGYFLEVDIHYPESLHDAHNEYPFCPENMTPPNGKCQKLIQNFFDKNRYVIHISNLKRCLAAGLKLTKIHRILTFKQSFWMKEYIDLNTRLRQASTNAFEKDFFKIVNNAIYGKSMESVDKHITVKLITNWGERNARNKRSAVNLIANPHFHSVSIFNENFVAIQERKSKIFYNKPIYVGFAVLDLSKVVMYDFHYGFIKQKYGPNAKLCYTDTDSFIYQIKTPNIYQDMKENSQYFDTSNYDPNNPYGIILQNKAVPGLFKDEGAGRLLWEFIGLRAKLYEINFEGKLTKKAKGLKKSVTVELSDADYKASLLDNKILYKRQNIFRSIMHTIYTQTVQKVALSSFDDKRHILENNIDTLAHGHFRIVN